MTASNDLVERLEKLATFMSKHDDSICRLEADCLEEAATLVLTLEADKAALVEALRDAIDDECDSITLHEARATLAKHGGSDDSIK